MNTHRASISDSTLAPASAITRDAGETVRQQLLARLPVVERRLSLNGVATAVLEGGAGPPIVLLHGPGAYGAQWLDLIPRLVATHRVIAPDLPGHGASGMFDAPPDADGVRAWIDDLIECTCQTPPVLVGHTLGGAMAAHFASTRGARLAALVLVDTLGLVPFQPTPQFGAALAAFLSAPAPDTQDRLWSQCLFDVSGARKRLGEGWDLINAYNLAGARRPGAIAALGGLMEQFGLPAIPSTVLERIAVPTTLIWGRADRATAVSVAEAASSRFGWPLHVIDGAADNPTLDQPEKFLDVLRRVLEQRWGKLS